ncbi:hypothetical protein [Synoicihabitans lomoniglobus]|uniref:Uncharacterized protein n=1 Tax=Synoicihabitans lomoniglobus TaxID=2909285 RepID=A0AAE9ZV21_9BACT|nr:hypothetical protein [Opitutaceae bacterium LMO-M01]WED63624.1 hypothetical protein PXH66_14905 [Opitutaceae bacterium LMO-M01]
MKKKSQRSPGRFSVGRALGWLGRASVTMLSSSVCLGLLLALYGLATHYVASMRHYAPLKIAGWFDVKSQVGNVFYAAAANAAEFFPHLAQGKFSDAIGNLTNMAGIRADIYTRLLHAGATNNAESFTVAAPIIIFVLLATRLVVALIRQRENFQRLRQCAAAYVRMKLRRGRRTPSARLLTNARDALQQEWRVLQFSFDQILVYIARLGVWSALFTALLLNTIEYYQGLSGMTGYLGYVGSGIATAIDATVATGAAVVKEISWHVFYLLTDGKEKTFGWLTRSQELEYVSHYLAKFPLAKIPSALHTAIYQAICAGAAWGLAHYLQGRIARDFVGIYESLPPHMRRYLAQRRPRRARRRQRTPGA